jgi:hypothetical protein
MRSRCTSGSAFSWIVSDAEVCRQKTVRSPLATPLAAIQFATASVTSKKPGPRVST